MLSSDIDRIVDRLENLIERKIKESQGLATPRERPSNWPAHWTDRDPYGDKEPLRKAIEDLIENLRRG